jgi:replicative DNA helicase
LDDTLGGGLDKGKLGLIIGSSGFGKTSMTTGIAAYAATYCCEQNDYKGYKVLQIVFEDTQRDIHRKYFSRLTQVETCKLNESPETTEMVKSLLKQHPDRDKIKNNIRIMRLKSGVYSASDIRGKIKKLINEGFKPDMVIIDYFECVDAEKGTKTLTKWEQEAKTMRCFENDAAELDMAFWIPVQGNRDSISAELVTMDKAGGAIQKVQIAQVIVSITRSVEDTKNQRATLSVLKNRSGAAGIVLNGIKFNNGTCTISCDEVIEFDDTKIYNDYAREEESKIVNGMVKSLAATIRNT